jgi:hypothetical protein
VAAWAAAVQQLLTAYLLRCMLQQQWAIVMADGGEKLRL